MGRRAAGPGLVPVFCAGVSICTHVQTRHGLILSRSIELGSRIGCSRWIIEEVNKILREAQAAPVTTGAGNTSRNSSRSMSQVSRASPVLGVGPVIGNG